VSQIKKVMPVILEGKDLINQIPVELEKKVSFK